MFEVITGNCLEVMKTFPDNYFTSVVTDPPYMLNFMGKEFDNFKNNPAKKVALWKEVLRVSKPGSTLLSFGGDRTHHHLMLALENAGWILKTCLYWIFSSGFPKNLNIGDAIDKLEGRDRLREKYYQTKVNSEWEGYGTALKPAAEIIIMAMKPNDGPYAKNALKHGVAGLNIDRCRIGTTKMRVEKSVGGIKSKNNSMRGENTNRKLHTFKNGRFPSNLLFDEEAAKQLGEYSRFFYCCKASRDERNRGCEKLEKKEGSSNKEGYVKDIRIGIDRNRPTLNFHPTVKPLKLMKYLLKLVQPPKDGLLLDPFAGSGSTIVAAKNLNFNAIGIEKSEEYSRIARARIKAAKLPERELF